MAEDLQTSGPVSVRTVEAHIDAMRDDLVRLVHALNRVHEHTDALKVQNAVMVLNELGGTVGFDTLSWPPQYDEADSSLARVQR